jgi:hypothetical protein
MLYSSSSRPKAVLHQQKGRFKQLWQLALVLCTAAALSGLWLAARFSHHLPSSAYASNRKAAASLTTAVTWVPGRIHDVLLHQIIQECMQHQDTVIAFHPTSTQAVEVIPTDDITATSAHASPAAAATGGCPAVIIPLAAADRSIGLCTDAALYMQLLGAWIVPGDPAAAQHSLQAFSLNCLAGQQQQQQATYDIRNTAAAQAAQTSRVAGAGLAGRTDAAAIAGAPGAAVLFLEPLYEPWLQWLQQHPAAVAAYAPNFEQVC